MGGVAVEGSKEIVDGYSGAKTFIRLSRILFCTSYIEKYWCAYVLLLLFFYIFICICIHKNFTPKKQKKNYIVVYIKNAKNEF